MGMSSGGSPVVYIPTGKLVFTLGEIPGLLAEARWPHVIGRRVVYPLRLSASNTAGAVLTSEDKSTLSKIWERAGVPVPVFPISEPDWQRYVDIFNASEERPAWELWCCVEDDGLTNAVLRAAAKESYASDLHAAIAFGEISARNPLTGRPVATDDIRVQTDTDRLLLSRDDFVKFARGALLVVEEGNAEQRAFASPSGADERRLATTENPVVRPGRRRVDAIGREIKAAIAQIRSRDTHAIIDQHAVMAELVGRLGKQGSCIVGAEASGGAVVWLTEAGKRVKLTKDALRKRLAM